MTQETTTSRTEVSFKDFLLKNKRNRKILWLAATAIVIQFTAFKYLYPYASFIHGDSFSYLEAANKNLDINTYMIGYSKFLRLFSVFTSSDTILVAFQYLLIQNSALFLLFTIFYFYKPGKVTQFILLGFVTFNPLFLHLANFVSSDCLFAALSLTWFTLLLWIIHRPTTKILIWQTLILYLVFTIRYNALIYPAIAAMAFGLSSLSLRKKIMGIGIGALLCGLFAYYTSYQYKKLTNYWQYSPFSGWQLTNNAMYAYRYVESANRKPVPKKFQLFDNMVRAYFDSTRDANKFPTESVVASTFYMWSPGMPMVKYRNRIFKNDTAATELKKWASMGPFYKAYGLYIIKQYPQEFIKYFLWPNAQKYYAPPIEFMKSFNSGKGIVTPQARDWFEFKTQKITARMNKKVWVLNFYPILSGIINVVMLFSLLFYTLLKGWQMDTIIKKGIALGGAVWLLNAVFTISASSAALRFQSFPIILTSVFVSLLLDWLWKVAMSVDIDSQKVEAKKLVLDLQHAKS
jgi:hypothetical protein